MNRPVLLATIVLFAAACTANRAEPQPAATPLEELPSVGIVESPKPVPGQYAPGDRDAVDMGRYLVVLLGCGACHTDGAFEGVPNMDMPLAGSQTGIAWTSPLETKHPGVVYPPNITPDEKTGIGLWTDAQIMRAIRSGNSRHGGRRLVTMPWQGYARLTDDDVEAIVAYLRSIAPVEHRVPAEVSPGQKARKPFVYFGVFRSRD